ncbi:MAG: hypothetical protein AB8G77_25095 [Rhodothermales bacterium]
MNVRSGMSLLSDAMLLFERVDKSCFSVIIVRMIATGSPLSSLLLRTLCLGVLLFSQYALALHAVEHSYHDTRPVCEVFHGVLSLDHAPLDDSAEPVLSTCGSKAVESSGIARPLAAANTYPIRAPPSVN